MKQFFRKDDKQHFIFFHWRTKKTWLLFSAPRMWNISIRLSSCPFLAMCYMVHSFFFFLVLMVQPNDGVMLTYVLSIPIESVKVLLRTIEQSVSAHMNNIQICIVDSSKLTIDDILGSFWLIAQSNWKKK